MMHEDQTAEGLAAIVARHHEKHGPNGEHIDGCGCLTTEDLDALIDSHTRIVYVPGRPTPEPMSDERLAEIEESAACGAENGDAKEMYRVCVFDVPDLIAEVRRHRGFIEYVATLGDTDNPAGAYSVLKELARRHLAGIPA